MISQKKIDILGLTPKEIIEELKKMGEKAFRGEQVVDWLSKGVISFADMTNLPLSTRELLDEKFRIGSVELKDSFFSHEDDTIKYLCLLEDHNIIECVVMSYHHGNTLCLSTQVGCRMGCGFCESTRGGLVRNLEAREMMGQLYMVNSHLRELGHEKVRNIVLMGSGEPLDNYENVMEFLRLVHNPQGLNMSYRNMTLSTCGLAPGIKRLAHEDIPITLSISLHAPNDRIRKKIMPVASAYSVNDIIEAGKYYFERTGRRVTFEYSLMDGINDKVDDAKELAQRLRGFPCHVNVIPINEIGGTPFKRSPEEKIRLFIETLKSSGINVTRRRELGQDIGGACGQLRRRVLEEPDYKG